MRILALGDVFGRPGRNLIISKAGEIRARYRADFLIVNCENASGGSGVSSVNANELLAVSSVDVYTSGNHIWDKKDLNNIIQQTDRILRPANYPSPCPGRGWGVYRLGGVRIGVVNLSGTAFMESLNNPFLAFDEIYEKIHPSCDAIVVDFHAEATSEKIAFGYHADGRANVVYGTHTHVQTNDARILERGTGYLTDIGMTGPYDGVIGVDREIIVKNYITQRRSRYETAQGRTQLNGAVFVLDEKDFRCTGIELVREIYD
ncbi:MAG: TIGR00282 family metallophosphoesterase [Eubacteriaceae bacterium]|nr:TIGR00282 family metallophosphoesterase [Eubacteriaceae bacterium]